MATNMKDVLLHELADESIDDAELKQNKNLRLQTST